MPFFTHISFSPSVQCGPYIPRLDCRERTIIPPSPLHTLHSLPFTLYPSLLPSTPRPTKSLLLPPQILRTVLAFLFSPPPKAKRFPLNSLVVVCRPRLLVHHRNFPQSLVLSTPPSLTPPPPCPSSLGFGAAHCYPHKNKEQDKPHPCHKGFPSSSPSCWKTFFSGTSLLFPHARASLTGIGVNIHTGQPRALGRSICARTLSSLASSEGSGDLRRGPRGSKSTSWHSYNRYPPHCRRRIDSTPCRLALPPPSSGVWTTIIDAGGRTNRLIPRRIHDTTRTKGRVAASRIPPHLSHPPPRRAEGLEARLHIRGTTKSKQPLPIRRGSPQTLSNINPATRKTNGSSKVSPVIAPI